MIASLSALLLGAASIASTLPVVEKRTVTALNQAAFEEAQQRDDTATRAFSSIPIKTSGGQCLFVDELSGDFRANLTPIQVGACDGSAGQLWDIVTSGKHNNQAGSMLIVSTLTQACFNFDPRRAAGNQVLLFACGGRADGTGAVTNSQLFPFAGGPGPLALAPENAPGTCLTVKGSVIDQITCNAADANQSFTFGDSAATTSAAAAPDASATEAAADECPADPPEDDTEETSAATSASSTSTAEETSTSVSVSSTTTSSTLLTIASSTTAAASSSSTTTTPPPPTTTSGTTTSAAPLSAVPVSRAGGVLNPSAAAEANVFDTTATRAFTSVSLKSALGTCLFVDPTAGDFRENLIPIALKPCDGSSNEKWDFITSGAHNNAANSTLIVSSETNGCINFDPRRAAGDTTLIFSCGGRADGDGTTTNSQLFPFAAGEKSITLAPENGASAVCLVPNAAGTLLDQAPCSGDASQLFIIE